MYTINENNYVIFICTFDPFGKGLAKYTFNAICNEEHSLVLDDGVTRVSINTEGDRHKISKELANLIGYISTGKVADDYTRQLDEEVRELRNDTGKGVSYMTYMQTLMEHENIGFDKGLSQANRETAIIMLQNNEPLNKIAMYSRLTMEQINELAASLHRVH